LPTYKHLRRLDSVRLAAPVYFITICVQNRRPILANEAVVSIFRDEFEAAPTRYGWRVGRFVAMPDHLHFFCVSDETPASASLSQFIARFKQWTAKRILARASPHALLWQKQFFDHLLRSNESYDSKWLYVRDNPVRAGFVATADEWPYGGEITAIFR
jgi:REP element-mobilizing transposase RayT